MKLENLNLVELNAQEMKETEGGFLPLIAVYACWGVMLVCSAIALGLRDGAAAK
jgi:lactobin A/cerein 7B family class IIb bacteriocin